MTESLANQLLTNKRRMVAAESCTGGLLCGQLSSIPGASSWFEGGFVTYALSAKRSMLGVPSATLDHYGAVSEPTARAMAEGALRHTTAHLSVAISGIAGPEGGDVLVPVGTVWFAWATHQAPAAPTCVYAAQHHFSGTRREVREQAVTIALEGSLQVAMDLS
jgi:nicotinamide-nucleotide amidase